MDWDGKERRSPIQVDEELIEQIAEKVLQKFYLEVGRSVVKKALWIIGAGTLALLAWLAGSGHIK